MNPVSPTTVLVVDDDPAVRHLLATVLVQAGYATRVAAEPVEARALLTKLRFGLVVSDLSMPKESGRSLIECITSAYPATAVLIVTGDDDPVTARAVTALGATGYLVKPFGTQQFLIAVSDALRRRRAEDRARKDTICRLTTAVGLRDELTGLHSERTGRYCSLIAANIGLDAATCGPIALAAPLHDIGKIAIPDRILHKPGPLTAGERRIMETHTTVGHQLLAGSDEEVIELAATIAWTHHERLDGGGYPRALRGDDIPVAGRIAAIADTLDALTSDRPYRPGYTYAEAVEVLVSLRGVQLEPEMVDALLGALDEGPAYVAALVAAA